MYFRRYLLSSCRGQSLSLTALMILGLTLSVMLTFSIGQRVREKIKMQALADASAYSLAVAEARAFNYYAWSNRAIVSHYVAMLSVSSYDSYLSFYQDLLARVATNYIDIEYQLNDECRQKHPYCACSVAACNADARARQIAWLYFTHLNTPKGINIWANPDGASFGAEAWLLEFQDKYSASKTTLPLGPNLMWCNQLLAGIKDHYGNRVPAIRYQQLDIETQLLWYLSGTSQIRPQVPTLETFSLSEDTPDPIFGNSVHGNNGTFGGHNVSLASRYGMADQLSRLTDSKVRTPERDQNLLLDATQQGAAPNPGPGNNLTMYAWPKPGTASYLNFSYYSAAVNNYPHPHEDYDEILYGSRIGDVNGSQLQKDWIVTRGWIPNNAHWNWFLTQATSMAAPDTTITTQPQNQGNSKAVSMSEGGGTDPGDPNLNYPVLGTQSGYIPFPGPPAYKYFVPSDPYAGGHGARLPAGPTEIGGPSYTFLAGTPDTDNNLQPPPGKNLAKQVHDSGFGTSFALASEDHGMVTTRYIIRCADGRCLNPTGVFEKQGAIPVGRNTIYGDPGPSPSVADQGGFGTDPSMTVHQHGMHIWSGVPYHEPGHSFSGASNFGNYPTDVDELCDSDSTCGLYQGHMQFMYPTGANNLSNQPRLITMLYEPVRSTSPQPWDFDFNVGLLGNLSFTTRNSLGDSASVSSATGVPMLGAMSAGLAYYHRPEGGSHSDWKEPPNLWNPFWRAKLHPIREDDALSVMKHDLIKSDDGVAAGLIGGLHHPFNY